MIYASNAKGLWNPQPQLEIQNATLTTQSINSVTTQPQSIGSQQQSYAVGNVDIPIPAMVLASSIGGVGLIIFCALIFVKTRRKENRQ